MTLTQQEQDLVVQRFRELEEAIKAYVIAAPKFDGETPMAGAIGRALGNLESELHWKCGIWELGLPKKELVKNDNN